MWTGCGQKATLLGQNRRFGPKSCHFWFFAQKSDFSVFFAYFFKKAFRNALELSKDPKKMQMEQKVVEDWLNKKKTKIFENFWRTQK
jgi:hypothetical protein